MPAKARGKRLQFREERLEAQAARNAKEARNVREAREALKQQICSCQSRAAMFCFDYDDDDVDGNYHDYE